MYVATSAPYGYKKDEHDRHRLVVDERYAPTVRLIFFLAKDGKGISQTRSYLNGQHILRPWRSIQTVMDGTLTGKTTKGVMNGATTAFGEFYVIPFTCKSDRYKGDVG